MTRATLASFGIIFILLGLAYTFEPVSMFASSGDTLVTAASITDIRAVYGGFELGLGMFLLLSAYKPERHKTALVASLWIFAGLIFSRSVGLLLDAGEQSFNYAVIAFEIFCVAWLAAAYKRSVSDFT